jgi:hypothetical protein
MPIVVDDIIVNRKKRNWARTITMPCTIYFEEPEGVDEWNITIDTDYMGLNPKQDGFEDELIRDVCRHYKEGMTVEELTENVENHWWGWGACFKKVQPPASKASVYRPKRLY